jgi:hypothetical protein
VLSYVIIFMAARLPVPWAMTLEKLAGGKAVGQSQSGSGQIPVSAVPLTGRNAENDLLKLS